MLPASVVVFLLLLAPPPVDELKSELVRLNSMAAAKVAAKDYAGADEAFRAALDLNRRQAAFGADSALRYAEFLTSQNRLSDAERLTSEILKNDPRFAPAYLQMANLRVAQNRREDSIRLAELALSLAEKDGAAVPAGRLEAIHLFLSVNYFAVGRQDLSRVHQLWIQQHR